MAEIRRIPNAGRLYQAERELRNVVLMRPIGMPDGAWEQHDGQAWHFVAVEGEDVVGCVLFLPKGRQQGQLMQMAVAEDKQGTGIGTRLLEALEGAARGAGFTEVVCHARPGAVDWYKAHGFGPWDSPITELGIEHERLKKPL